MYADDARVVSRLPKKLRKMMDVIVVMCVAFGLTVLEVKTEIICLRTKEMPEETTISNVEAAGHMHNQTNEFVYPGEHRPQKYRSVHRDRPAHTQCIIQLPEVHPRTVRPTERPPRAQNADAKSKDTRENAVRLRHVDPARMPLRHATTSPPQLSESLNRSVRGQPHRPSDFLDNLMETGSKSVDAIMRGRWILWGGTVARMGDTRLPNCVMFGKVIGGACCVEGQGK